MRWEEGAVPADDVRLHVRRVVEPAAAPILLLHGLGVSGAVWQAFARRLQPAYAAVAPDLRGHGLSDAPLTGYQPPDYARDLAALVEHVGLAPPAAPLAVLGHSLGSLVGLALAEARPDLVCALVLVDPPVDAAHPNPDVPQVYRLRHEPGGALEAYLLATNPGGGELLARALAGQFRAAADQPFQALLADPPGRPWAWQAAARVAAPTLVVQADVAHGGLLGDAAAEAFTRRLPRGQRVKLPGATHAVHASQPAELARVVLDFLGGGGQPGEPASSSSPSA